MTVPVEWSRPDGPAVKVARPGARPPSWAVRIGSMLCGPGWPRADSGVALSKQGEMSRPGLL
ncbi:hypothetical protein [Nonomuraea sp. JJY05]|uniref:hypothetical protein n=1 Tax=Nonomuraea sp. JJY05 TaxID=3350255 RepID=UPI00373EF411